MRNEFALSRLSKQRLQLRYCPVLLLDGLKFTLQLIINLSIALLCQSFPLMFSTSSFFANYIAIYNFIGPINFKDSTGWSLTLS